MPKITLSLGTESKFKNFQDQEWNIDPNLETVLTSYGIHAIFEEPTRIGTNSQTIIDQVIINKSLWEYKCQVIYTGFSDHYAQILELHNIKRENSISKKAIKLLDPLMIQIRNI